MTGPLAQGIVLTVIGFVPHIDVHPLIAAVAVSAIFTGSYLLQLLLITLRHGKWCEFCSRASRPP